MKILVTGSSGFLGTALVDFLEQGGHTVVKLNSKNCNLTTESNLYQFNEYSFDLIFHLAAWTQAGDFCINHPGEQWLINQKINTNILSWWSEYQDQAKFIFMGTSCAYAPGGNLIESEYMVGEPIDSLYTYAMTKRMLYQGARALNLQYGLKYLCAVPSTLYGAGYHTDGRQMHFIFDLIRKIIRGKEYGDPVCLWGDGLQKREIILVDDFVKILWALVESENNQIFNIGAGVEYSIREFAEMICKEVGYPFDHVTFDLDRYVGAKSKCLSILKAQESTPEYKLTSLKVGLKKTIAWFYESGAYKQSNL
jgi:GDP-L-fucose synthase